MNKLRRKLFKFSIIQFLALFISTKSFSIDEKDKNIWDYKTREFKGFIWQLDKKDK